MSAFIWMLILVSMSVQTGCVTGVLEPTGALSNAQDISFGTAGDGDSAPAGDPAPQGDAVALSGDAAATEHGDGTETEAQPELCDGFDNDGDGVIDEDIAAEQCTDSQGNSGTTVCVRGATVCESCTPGAQREVECCGPNRAQICNSKGLWPPVACDGCTEEQRPFCDEYDACTPGDEQIRRCDTCTDVALCGVDCTGASWVCTEECVWQEVAPCEYYPVQCSEDAAYEQPCGRCGSRALQCDGCFWEVGACEQQGECDPGDTKPVPCAAGTSCEPGRYAVVTCNQQCQWEGADNCEGCTLGSDTQVEECVPGADCGVRIVETACTPEIAGICGGSATLPLGQETTRVIQDDCVDIACAPGATQGGSTCTTALGECGTRPLLCSNTCEWQNDGECVARAGACVPGTTSEQTHPCNNSCDPAAEYTVRTTCGASGCGTYDNIVQSACPACDQGQTRNSSCTLDDGRCGTQAYTCSASCDWSVGTTGCVARSTACIPGEEGATRTVSCGADMCGATTERVTVCRSNGCGTREVTVGTCPACAAGSSVLSACTMADGRCGNRETTCDADCGGWTEGTCVPSDASCVPEATEQEACVALCDLPGTRSRTCASAGCGWNAWSACQPDSEPVCVPGETESVSCAGCPTAVSSRVCDEVCAWDTWTGCPQSCL